MTLVHAMSVEKAVLTWRDREAFEALGSRQADARVFFLNDHEAAKLGYIVAVAKN
ncbi:hypothetical protein C1H46_034124 [Malus baccata]|uniref:Uncharacterized protein n=1 Tax=Malus baccata TaxID=106549 RepID=A0A540L1G4_MALBA|nr:hypothetical protein C1H46_034124 [Malus baccata]